MKSSDIVEFAKRRGIFWQRGEIYGAISGFYDYGPIGFMIKKRFEELWRRYFLSLNENFYEIEACSILPKEVFVASGHLKSFADPVVRCSKCGNEERADQILEEVLKEKFEGKSKEDLMEVIKRKNIRCPKCGGRFEEIGELNLMFPISVGTGSEKRDAYLSPETAQGAYINFSRCYEVMRRKLPLGLAIVGKAFRNEISPRNVLLRMREFKQAELQIFFDPARIDEHDDWKSVKNYALRLLPVNKKNVVEMSCEDARKALKLPRFYLYFMAKVQQFYIDVLNVSADIFRFRELGDDEKAFYNKYHWDVEVYFNEFDGFKEVAGVHYRTDHDLSGHQSVSGKSMEVQFIDKKVLPHVLELSFGIDRNMYMLLDVFFKKEKERNVLALPPLLSPFDVAVFPLVNKDGLPELAKGVKEMLSKAGLRVFYDDSGSIGRRYRRMDEIGNYLCITIDYQSKEKGDCTLRYRDTMEQERVKFEELEKRVREIVRKFSFNGG